MGRLLAGFGILFGLLLVPIALAPNVVWMVIPGHLVFSVLVILGALQQGFEGNEFGAKAWGVLYLITSVGIAIAMEFSGATRDSWYWMVPWAMMLTWAWVPAIAIAVGAWMGPIRRRRLSAAAVRKRKQRRRGVRGGPGTGRVDEASKESSSEAGTSSEVDDG